MGVVNLQEGEDAAATRRPVNPDRESMEKGEVAPDGIGVFHRADSRLEAPLPPSMDNLRESYAKEKAQSERTREFFAYAIYRPLSFRITPFFIRSGLSANAVSAIALATALTMPLVAFLGLPGAWLWLAAAAVSCLVLDCVDGNIARAVGSEDTSGEYIDSMVGKAYYILLALALAGMASHEVPGLATGYWLCIALTTSLFHLWARESRLHFKTNDDIDEEFFVRGRTRIKTLALALPDAVPAGLVLLGPFGLSYLLLIGLLALRFVNFAYTQRRIFRHLRG